ncbi:MAG: DUF1559 domain-containing protein [Gemmataceae bacterium]
MIRSPSRPGLTLIEVLVTLSILSILFALLLPAVQKVRAVADRMACQSKLRQIQLGTLHYESTFGKLPPAFRHPGPTVTTPYLQWPILIAPYLEQDALHRMAMEDYKQYPDPIFPHPHRGLSEPMAILACPLDTRVREVWEVSFRYSIPKPNPDVKVQIALNSYLGNGGAYHKKRDGVIIADGKLAMTNIRDGTSNTLAFGERPPPMNLQLGWIYAGWGAVHYSRGELASVMVVRDKNPYLLMTPPNTTCGTGPFPFQAPDLDDLNDCAKFQYWSLHTGEGANFAFADGSVRFLTYNADSVLAALATRAGGESVEVP